MLLSFNRLDSADFVALGEATFTEEAASLVSDDLTWFIVVFRCKWLHFLLNDLHDIICKKGKNSIFWLSILISLYKLEQFTYIWAVTVVSAATFALFLLTEHGPRFLFFFRGCCFRLRLGLSRLQFV